MHKKLHKNRQTRYSEGIRRTKMNTGDTKQEERQEEPHGTDTQEQDLEIRPCFLPVLTDPCIGAQQQGHRVHTEKRHRRDGCLPAGPPLQQMHPRWWLPERWCAPSLMLTLPAGQGAWLPATLCSLPPAPTLLPCTAGLLGPSQETPAPAAGPPTACLSCAHPSRLAALVYCPHLQPSQ